MLFNSLHFISSTTSVESYTVHMYALHDAKLKDIKQKCEILQNPENVLGRYISTLYSIMNHHHSFCRSVRFLVGVNYTQNIYRQTQRTCSGKCTYIRTANYRYFNHHYSLSKMKTAKILHLRGVCIYEQVCAIKLLLLMCALLA